MPNECYRSKDILSKLGDADIHIRQDKTAAETKTIRIPSISEVKYTADVKNMGE